MAKHKRKGRPRKEHLPRTESGQLSRGRGRVAAEAVDRVATEARTRLFGISNSAARDQKAGTALGRLSLSGEISRRQYMAGERILSLRSNYLTALSAPKGPEQIWDSAAFTSTDEEQHAAWCRAVIAAYDAAIRAMVAAGWQHRNSNLIGAVDSIIYRDQPLQHLVGDLRLALNALARHFGLDKVAA